MRRARPNGHEIGEGQMLSVISNPIHGLIYDVFSSFYLTIRSVAPFSASERPSANITALRSRPSSVLACAVIRDETGGGNRAFRICH